ncbi:MAG: hypothetical protein U0074_10770 [Kouleothrix sp.]
MPYSEWANGRLPADTRWLRWRDVAAGQQFLARVNRSLLQAGVLAGVLGLILGFDHCA